MDTYRRRLTGVEIRNGACAKGFAIAKVARANASMVRANIV